MSRPARVANPVPRAILVAISVVLAGCSAQPGDGGGQPDRPPPTSSSTTSAAAPTTPGIDPTQACQLLDTAASGLLLGQGIAIATNEKGPALQEGVAAAYTLFAETLRAIAPRASADLRPALTDWASASDDVARFVIGYVPRPDMVLEFGPAHPRWEEAQRSAETICGHPLPNR